MQDKPDAAHLLDAIQEFLMKDILPRVKEDDGLAFKTLVSWNMIGVVAREIREEEGIVRKELEDLNKLLGESRKPQTYREAREVVYELNQKLVASIRESNLSRKDGQVWDHVKQTLEQKLSIANPRFGTDS